MYNLALLELRMYIFFSGDLHFFAVLPAKISWGDTYMYKYKYIYMCVYLYLFVSIFHFQNITYVSQNV